MSERYSQLIVVDPAPEVEAWVKEQLKPTDRHFYTLDAAAAVLGGSIMRATAVIANLAPDHFNTFTTLANLGVKNIVCEKPITDSLATTASMVYRATTEKIRLTVGFPRRFTGAASDVIQTAIDFLGGVPSAIVVHGGAKCLVTFGSHFVDFAIELFGSTPIRVAAVGTPAQINPRGIRLDQWGGSASWEFSEDRYLSMMLSNSSSVQSLATIYAPTGRFEMHLNGSISVYKRDPAIVANDPRITRVGFCEPEGMEIVGALSPSTIALMLDEVESDGTLTYSGTQIERSHEAMIGALIAIESQSVLEFPISQDHGLYGKYWNIT